MSDERIDEHIHPIYRMRRGRRTTAIRRMVRETRLSVDQLIQPLFAVCGENVRREIPSMPGQHHLSIDRLVAEASELYRLGIPAVLLFGIPEEKDELGSSASTEDGIVQRAVRALKRELPDLVVITDVCLCQYTTHGHCGLLSDDGIIENDASVARIVETALSHAAAGADFVAPSDMFDGRVGAIRGALDGEGMTETGIIAYAVKYASAFYGPFRDVARSSPAFGDRASHQMDPANGREAVREAALDVEEGADIVMVKPAMAFLDIVQRLRRRFDLPLAAYNVSGEYSMIKAAAAEGWIDEDAVADELLTSITRAGADLVITYYARHYAESQESSGGSRQ